MSAQDGDYRCVWCGHPGTAIWEQVVKVGKLPTGWLTGDRGIPLRLWRTLVTLRANMLYVCYNCAQPVQPGSHEALLVPAWMWPEEQSL